VAHDNDNSLSDITVCFPVNSNSNFVNIRVHVHVTRVLMNYIFVNCDNTFSDSCLFENDTSFDFQNFNSIILEIYVISDFDIINLDFLNDISFCENDAH
jgi:hypothetical protein